MLNCTHIILLTFPVSLSNIQPKSLKIICIGRERLLYDYCGGH